MPYQYTCCEKFEMIPERFCFFFRQGRYRYKRGTTAILTEKVKKLDFEVVASEVKGDSMDTS